MDCNSITHIRRLLQGLIIVLLITFTGCQKYGSVSPKAYEVAKSLYSICNRKDDQRLSKVEIIVSESLEKEELSPSEAEWLLEIVIKAKSQKWDQAMMDSRIMLKEQIR